MTSRREADQLPAHRGGGPEVARFQVGVDRAAGIDLRSAEILGAQAEVRGRIVQARLDVAVLSMGALFQCVELRLEVPGANLRLASFASELHGRKR